MGVIDGLVQQLSRALTGQPAQPLVAGLQEFEQFVASAKSKVDQMRDLMMQTYETQSQAAQITTDTAQRLRSQMSGLPGLNS
jgi:hypothetical protein